MFRNVEVGTYAVWAAAAIAVLALVKKAKAAAPGAAAAPGEPTAPITSAGNPADYRVDLTDAETRNVILALYGELFDVPVEDLVTAGWKIQNGYLVNPDGRKILLALRSATPRLGSGSMRDFITAPPSVRVAVQEAAAETSAFPGKYYDKRESVRLAVPDMY